MAGRSDCLAIGIDLGTTYSCVAVWQNNRIEVIPNEQGNRTTHSCVAFTDNQRLIGDAAKNLVARNPTNTVFGKDFCKKINPDKAVAYGAAVLAAKISGYGNEMVQGLIFSDVTPLSLGYFLNGDVMSVMIPKNTPIPIMKEGSATTCVDYQTAIKFQVYQGERSKATDNIFLGEFRLQNIPVAPRGITKAKVRFEIDVNGLLEVSAEELTTGQKTNVKISNGKRSLPKEEIQKMLRDAKKFKVEDQNYRKKMEAYNDLEYYIYLMKRRVKDDSIRKRLNPEDLSKMDDLVEGAIQWLEMYKLAEADVITDKKKILECVCNSIIGQFM
ncbi:heat shock cognate 70 kDa protein 2-like [Rutidosis leptorrhynchoides]|uniref:heat shock cognate 70 kDa protein 2-like n=1 Tax=Rutidosis leptorrhynchoides TaxID=125765 RepID=UPI003A99C86E